ncbi:unnamed protein product, partial [Closterium sp. NIES-53]
ARTKGTGAGGAAGVGAGGIGARASGLTGAAGPRGARTRGTRAAGAGGAARVGAGGIGAGAAGLTGGIGPEGACTRGNGAAGAGGAARVGAGDTRAGGAGPKGSGAVLGLPSSIGLTPPLLCPPPDQTQPLLQPASPLPAPSPYTEQAGGPTQRREPVSRLASPVRAVRIGRRVPRPRPPPVPGTHHMAFRPSSVPQSDPLPSPPWSSLDDGPDPESDLARSASPTVPRLLATIVTEPSFESPAASALVTELVDFAAFCRLDYATTLVAESGSACPPSVGGECALGTDVLEDRQEEFECLAASVPSFVAMLLAPEGDPDAPDIPTPRSYAEAIMGPYSSQWRTAIDAKMASWNLRLPVYGLCQAPYEWHNTLRTTLAALGFTPLTADPSLFLRTDTSLPPFYVLVYVLQRFGFWYSSPQSTPLPTGHLLSAPTLDESVELSGPYPELVGCLMYLMTCTRPDLAYPLSILARYVAPGRHRPEHWEAAKRVLRYLCSTTRMGLVLGHADASWVDGLATQRSSQAYTFTLGSCSVSWRSARSSSILSSSCEAEIYAGAMAAQELRWLTYLLTDMGERPRSSLDLLACYVAPGLRWLTYLLTDLGEAPRSPPVLYVDNKAMIALCQEHRPEHRTKHIALRYFLARELQQRGQLRLAYVATRANTADIFTKALQSALVEALHTFTLDSSASRCFFHDSTTLTPLPAPVPNRLADPSGGLVLARSSTVLPCLAAPSGSLSGLHLPSFSTNLVSTAALPDAMVTTTTPGGQLVSICTCTRTGRHLATFTRRPGLSLYTLTTEPPHVVVSTHVSASGPVASPYSCRLLSHQTLLRHQRLGHPSLPRLRGMHSCLLVSGLPRSLPPLQPSPAPPCLPCVEGWQRAAPHSSSFPPTTAPLHSLHMDVLGPVRVSGQGCEHYFLLVVEDFTHCTTFFPLRIKGEVPDVLIPWICAVRLQLRERFRKESCVCTLIEVRCIGLVMEVARTSMIHADAPHFLWPFAVQYAAHQLNLWPRVSLPETLPTLRWTMKVDDALVFRVRGFRAFVCDTSEENKLSSCAIPRIFLGFPPDAPGCPLPPHLAPCPALLGHPLPLAEPVEVTVDSGATRGGAARGAASWGAEPAGTEVGGAETESAEPGGAESEGAESGGAEPRGTAFAGGPSGALPRQSRWREPLSPRQLRKWFARRTRLRSGAVGAGGPAAGGTGAGGAGATSLVGAGVTAGAGGTGAGGVGGDGAGDPGAGGVGAGGTRVGDPAAKGAGAGGAGAGGAGAGGAGVGGTGAGGTVQRRPFFVPPPPSSLLPPGSILHQLLNSPLPAPSPYAEQTDTLTERCEPASRPALSVCAVRTVAELVDFAAACRLDYGASLVAESESDCPPSIGGEFALGTDVFEDR